MDDEVAEVDRDRFAAHVVELAETGRSKRQIEVAAPGRHVQHPHGRQQRRVRVERDALGIVE